MIMRPGQAVLLPVSTTFALASLLLALIVNMVLSMAFQGQTQGLPDLLVIALLFWSFYAHKRVGMSLAFLLGIVMDVHTSSLLGQHALAYVVLMFLGISLQRRLVFFSPTQQAFQLVPVFFAVHACQWFVRALSDGAWGGWWLLLAPVLETMLWPVCFTLLQWPQRRAHSPDQNRPL